MSTPNTQIENHTGECVQAILLVHDTASIRQALQIELAGRFPDAQVVPASHGKEALDMLRAGPVDLVVTGLHLPQMDGITFLCHIMDEHPHLPCILLASLHEEVQNYSGKTGALAILDQDSAIPELVSEVKAWLDAFSVHAYSAGLTLSYLVQLIKLEGRDCEMGIQDPATGLLGVLRFKKGQLADATAGDLPSDEAAVFLLSRPRVHAWIHNGDIDGSVRLEHPLDYFLTRAARILDEGTDPFLHLADATKQEREPGTKDVKQSSLSPPPADEVLAQESATEEATQTSEERMQKGAPTPDATGSAPKRKGLQILALLLVGIVIVVGVAYIAYMVITAEGNHTTPGLKRNIALAPPIKPPGASAPAPEPTEIPVTPKPPGAAALAPEPTEIPVTPKPPPAAPTKPAVPVVPAKPDTTPPLAKQEVKKAPGIPDTNQRSRLALLTALAVKHYAALLTEGVVAIRKQQIQENLEKTLAEIEQMYEKLSRASGALDDRDLASAVDACRANWKKMSTILGEKPSKPGFRKLLYLDDAMKVTSEALAQRLIQQYDHHSSPQESAANEIGVRVTELASVYLAVSMDIDRKKHVDEIMSTIKRIDKLVLGLERAPDNTGQIRGIIRSCTGMEWRQIRQCMSECAGGGKVEFKGLKMIVFTDTLSRKTERLAVLYEELDKQLNAQ